MTAVFERAHTNPSEVIIVCLTIKKHLLQLYAEMKELSFERKSR